MITVLRQTLYPSSSCKSHSIIRLPLLRFHLSTAVEDAQSAIHLSSVYKLLVHKHRFPPKLASQIASAVTRSRNPEKFDSVLSFFKESGFSNSQLEKMLKCRPRLLSANLDKTIKPKIKVLQDMGLSTCEIVSSNPLFLGCSLNKKIIPALSVLQNLLGASEMSKLLKAASSRIFKRDLNNTLVANMKLLNECGVSMDQIINMIHFNARVMLREPEDMKKLVDKADEMGVRRTSKSFFHAVLVLGGFSEKAWNLKLRSLQELGFSGDDITAAFRGCPRVFGLSVATLEHKMRNLQEVVGFSDENIAMIFRNHPAVFCYSVEKITGVKEVLLENGKYTLSSIVSYPVCLTYSIEKRYKPRLQILELLEAKNLIKSWPAFTSFCIISDKSFYKKYVAPFLDEVGGVYVTESATSV